jgi:hypothetical protein
MISAFESDDVANLIVLNAQISSAHQPSVDFGLPVESSMKPSFSSYSSRIGLGQFPLDESLLSPR